ncbi:MAG: glycosyltransferase family 2 protein, partial [Bdellovibrionales bacterium]|nr:glycosyltransferase family 2 protein [Bdellovibrionales bacterium]
MANKSTVSIIITCYNYGHFLEECVASVLAQDYHHWEAIIVDDGSKDNTEQIASGLVHRNPHKLTYLKLENGGVSRARNIGIEQTSGEYILALDADDILHPTALSEYVRCIESDPNYGFAYGCLDMLGSLPGEPTQWLPGPFSWKLFRYENLASVTSLWKRTFFDDGVRFRDGFFFEDWDLWLQIIERGYPGGYIPVPTFLCRTHLDGRTSFARYFHTQALAQQLHANKKLFSSEQNRMYAETVLFNAPTSFAKPTFLFLTSQDAKVSGAYIAKNQPLLEHLVSEKYFVALMGNINNVPHLPKGVYAINLQDEWADKIIASQVSGQGKNTIVITQRRDSGLIRGVKQQLPISLILSHEEHLSGISDYTLKYLPPGILIDSPGLNIFDPPKIHSTLKSFTDWASRVATERHIVKQDAYADHRKKQLQLAQSEISPASPSIIDGENDATLIIPTRNVDPDRLKRCMQSIRKNTFQGNLSIIVSDYGSCAKALAETKSLCTQFGATLIQSKTRQEWSRGRALNIGAKHATTKWIIFTDADMIFSPHLLACWEMYRSTFGDTSFYLAQCKKLPPIQNFPQ